MIIRNQQDVTTAVLAEAARADDPRMRELLTAAVKHLHGFVREVSLTEAEFHQICGVIARLGQLTTPSHNEVVLAYEAKRDLAAELLEAVSQMKAGKTEVVSSPAVEARERTGLSQSQFAALPGVSVRTLQGWEQGRKQPSGAARTLLSIARTNPKALLAVAGK